MDAARQTEHVDCFLAVTVLAAAETKLQSLRLLSRVKSWAESNNNLSLRLVHLSHCFTWPWPLDCLSPFINPRPLTSDSFGAAPVWLIRYILCLSLTLCCMSVCNDNTLPMAFPALIRIMLVKCRDPRYALYWAILNLQPHSGKNSLSVTRLVSSSQVNNQNTNDSALKWDQMNEISQV